jgi:cytoskeletal protein RodZ
MNELDQLLQETLDAAADRVPVSEDAWIRNEELLHAHRSQRSRTAVWLSTAAAGVVAILVAVMIWVVPGQHGAAPASGDRHSPPTTAGIPQPTAHPSTTPSASETPPSTADSTAGTSPASTGPINEQADDTLRSQLLQAFTAYRSQPDHPKDQATIPPSAVAGITAKSLYYAYVPSTNTYWAKAKFDATPAAAQGNDFIGFQDGGSMAVFSRTGAGAWTVTYVGPCDLTIPADVAQVWSLPSHSDDPLCN